MLMREILAGTLRNVSATQGLVLAARTTGKVKAFTQGWSAIVILGLPVFTAVGTRRI